VRPNGSESDAAYYSRVKNHGRRKRNGQSYARKGVSIGVPRHGFTPKVGDKFYVSGKLVTIKRKDGDGMLWFNRDVNGTVAMSESNLYQAAYVPEDSPFAPYEYRIKKNPTPVRVKVGKRVYNGKARRVGGRVRIYLPPSAVAKLNPDRKWTIAEIRAANRGAGYHFFDAKTMKFFGTKVLPGVSSGPNGIYFVTSELYGHGPRTYKVRSFDPSSSQIRSVGDHNNAEDAKADARSSAKA